MRNFMIPISGLVAVSCTATSSVSFAEETDKEDLDNENQNEGAFVTETYVTTGYKGRESFNEADESANKTITQTTKIVKEKEPDNWFSRLKNIKTLALGVLASVGYTAFAVGGVALSTETIGLTKFAENKLGIDKSVAQTTVIGSGILGATAAVVEYIIK